MYRTPLPIVAALALAAGLAAPAGAQEAARPPQPEARCTLTGTVTAGQTRLPGVAITVTPRGGGAPVTSSTALDGRFALALPGPGEYELCADFAAFAAEPRVVTLGTPCQAQADITMTLASRVPRAAAASPPPPNSAPAPAAGPRAAPAPGARRPPGAQAFQPLAPIAEAAGRAAEPGAETIDRDAAAQLSLPPGFSIDSSVESITATGSSGQMNNALLFGMMGEGPMGREGMPGEGGDPSMGGSALGPAGAFGGAGGFFSGGGPGGMAGPGGGMGGGPGGMGGRGSDGPGGGGPGMPRLAMAGRMGNNRPRGTVNYTLGGSMLNAAPYSLTGNAVTEPEFLQQRIAANFGGPVKIPGVVDWSQHSNFFLNYSGNHSDRPVDTYSTVPTSAMRAGDFSATSRTIRDPLTGLPFAGNQIPASRLDPTALALLAYIPLPNLDGDTKNFNYSTTASTDTDDINFRFMRSFGNTQRRPSQPLPAGGGGRGGGGAMRGGGVNVSVAVGYSRSRTVQASAFPTTGSVTNRTGWNVPVTVGFTKWGLMNQVRFQFNRSDATTQNRYAFVQDVAGNAGIAGVSADGFDWGVPNLSFSTLTSLRDVAPSSRLDQTITIGDTMTKLKGRHTLRWGGDARFMSTDSRVNTNPRGTFVFTGAYSGGGSASLGGRNDFADFLLGLTQQATVQYGPGLQQFRASAWNVFLQDDWRLTNRFTINAGVRYEYLSPYSETNNHLVTLDVAPGFTAAVPVVAGSTGPYSGSFTNTIVRADRNNVAPRVGFAWRPRTSTTVRGGYGISYSSPVYYSIVQRLAGQPPFAVTDTRLAGLGDPLTIASAFATPNPVETTNNFAVDPAYQLGWVQMWNLDVQRDLARTLFVGVGYTGTKGSHLDLQRAPNRGPLGPTIPDVQPFIWAASEGRSLMHALNLRLRKRMSRGFSAGLSYTWSKSMDDASSIGGGAVVVAQNDKDLAAEWGLSSFDQRHRLTADYSIQLPFGPNRRWLNRESWLAHVFGGWLWNGTISYTSGTPFTARILGNPGDVARGTYGTLRADYNGDPITIGGPTIAQFFNTAAFSVPSPGAFGNAARNTIQGPAATNVNMTLMKSFSLGGTRTLSTQVQANNVFNLAQYGSIDTAVNSPTFGQVVSMRQMRTVQLVARFGF